MPSLTRRTSALRIWGKQTSRERCLRARFDGAFMDAAKLGNADLRGASFRGTILNGSELNGALLDGADFRGALGVTAAQICSAKSRNGVQLDDPLSQQVAACGANP